MAVKAVTLKGRGVFADSDYPKGAVVLGHEILPLPEGDRALDERSFLNAYIFCMQDVCFLALGEGSLLNHSADPNLGYRFRKSEERIEFHALRPIASGEELTIDYEWDDYPWEDKE